jgi:WD40 repeat protein
MNSVRYKHAAVILNDGNVLIVGGSDNRDWRGKYNSAEIFHTLTGKFISVSKLSGERFKLSDAVALLHDGKVIIAGGNSKVEIYDPVNEIFTQAGELPASYYYSTATMLNDGSILIAGGYDNSIEATSGAWIYK